MKVLANADESILISAGEPEELELFGRGGVGEEVARFFGVGRGGEAPDPGEFVEVGESEVQGLPAAHGEAGEGAVFAVRVGAVTGLDSRDDVVQQVALEGSKGGGGFKDITLGPIIFLRAAVG